MSTSVTTFEFQNIYYKKTSVHNEKFDEKSNTIYLSEQTLKLLKQLNKKHKNKLFTRYSKHLVFKNYVGVLQVGPFIIDILPKILAPNEPKLLFSIPKSIEFKKKREILIKNLLYMQSWIPELSFIDIEDVSISSTTSFYETVINIFIKKLLKMLKSNQDRQYQRKTEKLKHVRERIDTRRYGINLAELHKIPCIFHERTLNTPINITFKYTLSLIIKKTRDKENYLLIKKALSLLSDVTITRITPKEVERIEYNRLNKCFKPLINFCKIFLKNSTIKLSGEKLETFSLLLPMELLFEHFISNYLDVNYKELLPEKLKYKPKKPKSIGYLVKAGSDDLFRLEPDIHLIKEYTVIIDTKYKLLKQRNEKKFKNYKVKGADIYQMYAYCQELNAKKCILLYPQSYEGKIDNVNWKLGIKKDIELFIRTISLFHDLTQDTGLDEFKTELTEVFSCLTV